MGWGDWLKRSIDATFLSRFYLGMRDQLLARVANLSSEVSLLLFLERRFLALRAFRRQ